MRTITSVVFKVIGPSLRLDQPNMILVQDFDEQGAGEEYLLDEAQVMKRLESLWSAHD